MIYKKTITKRCSDIDMVLIHDAKKSVVVMETSWWPSLKGNNFQNKLSVLFDADWVKKTV